MRALKLTKIENKFRPVIVSELGPIIPKTVIRAYSFGRKYFLEKYKEEPLPPPYIPPKQLERVLWGLTFRSPLMNAAGMFKNWELRNYERACCEGAGGFWNGTGTSDERAGNQINGIWHPFLSYPKSGAASNTLGLPNDGDKTNSHRINEIKGKHKIPIFQSLALSPSLREGEKFSELVKSMRLYESAGVDGIEQNESCPNTREKSSYEELEKRTKYMDEAFLRRRQRNLPVIFKLSTDTNPDDIPFILDLLFSHGYNGINLGNSSTNYGALRHFIDTSERKMFDYFTANFKGGITGRPLKEKSLALCARAAEYLKEGPPTQEFHVIRTGGIESHVDLIESDRAGVSLNQWFTGYWENFDMFGENVYKAILENYLAQRN